MRCPGVAAERNGCRLRFSGGDRDRVRRQSTLLDLRALDEPFQALLGSAALRPQWFALMLQLSFIGGLTGRYVDFTTAQRGALAMLAEREGVPLTAVDIDGLVGRMSSLPPHPEVPGALAALARSRPAAGCPHQLGPGGRGGPAHQRGPARAISRR